MPLIIKKIKMTSIILGFAIIAIIAGAIIVISIICNSDTQKSVPQPEAKQPEEKVRNIDYYSKIAGVYYHDTTLDIGGFIGYIAPEPTNEHDPDAIAIYRHDDKLMGYIPKNRTNEIRKWSEKEILPCVGYIESFVVDREMILHGFVKVLDAGIHETIDEITDYINYMDITRGLKFIPPTKKSTRIQDTELAELLDTVLDEL